MTVMSSGSVSHTNNALNRWKPTSSSCGRSGVRKGLAIEMGLNKTQAGAISRRRSARFWRGALRDSFDLLPWTTRQVEVGCKMAEAFGRLQGRLAFWCVAWFIGGVDQGQGRWLWVSPLSCPWERKTLRGNVALVWTAVLLWTLSDGVRKHSPFCEDNFSADFTLVMRFICVPYQHDCTFIYTSQQWLGPISPTSRKPRQ